MLRLAIVFLLAVEHWLLAKGRWHRVGLYYGDGWQVHPTLARYQLAIGL